MLSPSCREETVGGDWVNKVLDRWQEKAPIIGKFNGDDDGDNDCDNDDDVSDDGDDYCNDDDDVTGEGPHNRGVQWRGVL